MDWSKNITKQKREEDVVISGRIPKRYKKFIEENNIVVGKLVMEACNELNHSLKEVK